MDVVSRLQSLGHLAGIVGIRYPLGWPHLSRAHSQNSCPVLGQPQATAGPGTDAQVCVQSMALAQTGGNRHSEAKKTEQQLNKLMVHSLVYVNMDGLLCVCDPSAQNKRLWGWNPGAWVQVPEDNF